MAETHNGTEVLPSWLLGRKPGEVGPCPSTLLWAQPQGHPFLPLSPIPRQRPHIPAVSHLFNTWTRAGHSEPNHHTSTLWIFRFLGKLTNGFISSKEIVTQIPESSLHHQRLTTEAGRRQGTRKVLSGDLILPLATCLLCSFWASIWPSLSFWTLLMPLLNCHL